MPPRHRRQTQGIVMLARLARALDQAIRLQQSGRLQQAEPLEILVAGCGTGLQPISLALSYRDLRVVAVDLSNLSGCRDLLFHTRERRYSLPELKHKVERHRLRFLGFDLHKLATRQLYRTRFPDHPAMTDLARWQALEEEYPDSFADMYRFWSQKPSA